MQLAIRAVVNRVFIFSRTTPLAQDVKCDTSYDYFITLRLNDNGCVRYLGVITIYNDIAWANFAFFDRLVAIVVTDRLQFVWLQPGSSIRKGESMAIVLPRGV